MKTSELRNKSVADLNKELDDLHREQFNMRMQKGLGQTFKPHLIKEARRKVARVKTVLSELKGSNKT
jgi:large subunit ribosomal protein L29